jgi:acyl carrier protein
MTEEAIGSLILAHLIKNGRIGKVVFAPDAEIFAHEQIDSLEKLEVTIFIEDQFNVQVDEEQLTALGSIERLASYLARALNSKAA